MKVWAEPGHASNGQSLSTAADALRVDGFRDAKPILRLVIHSSSSFQRTLEPILTLGYVARVSAAHPGERDSPRVRFAYPGYESNGVQRRVRCVSMGFATRDPSCVSSSTPFRHSSERWNPS